MIKIILLAFIVCLVSCVNSFPNFEVDDLEDDDFDKMMAELEENGSEEFNKKYTIPSTTTAKTTTDPIFNENVYASIREARNSMIRASSYLDDLVMQKKRNVKKFFGYDSDE